MEDAEQFPCSKCDLNYDTLKGASSHEKFCRGDNLKGRATVEVACSVCRRTYRKLKQRAHTQRSFCQDCRGTEVRTCAWCGTFTRKAKANLRKLDAAGSKVYCSHQCKSESQKKPWEKLSRSSLRSRWIAEFGETPCVRCGLDEMWNIQIHHITYVCKGGTNDPENLEPLCLCCHNTEHFLNGPDDDWGFKPKEIVTST